ncbi:MAG: NAD(P)-dependent oxidoreductase [Gammaproteobacteria bacterium]|nr:NAD(P)-dependent oxidoreductase [Gammaproteobacteria bacterium]MDH3506493.1 NAD(P)-dependent oxidoreductase [Gammaproteobacteria bacterium]
MVGVIGLGIMGGAIARNLIAADQKVCGFDPDPDRRREAEANGVVVLESAAAVAARASIVLTSLPSVAALEQVTDQLANLPESDVDGLIVAELSTLPIEDKVSSRDRLAERGIMLLDCPLSGTGAQAAVGDLVIYASGDAASCKSCEKVFLGFGRACPYLGEFGNGTKMKFVANLLVAIHNVATAEAMLLGVRSGLDAQVLYEVVGSGAGNSRVFELRGPLMVSEDYEPATMKLEVWQKDMQLIREFAEKNGVVTPLFTASAPVYTAAVESGRGNEDTAAVYEVLKTLSDGKPES